MGQDLATRHTLWSALPRLDPEGALVSLFRAMYSRTFMTYSLESSELLLVSHRESQPYSGEGVCVLVMYAELDRKSVV